MADDGSIRIISEVLEKMIDSQIANTEALTSLKGSVDELNVTTDDIKSHFTNGFRSEIKEHMTEQINSVMVVDEKICIHIEQLTEEIKSFKGIGFWFKAVGAFMGSMAILIAAVATIITKMG